MTGSEQSTIQTRVAVLGTLAEFHREPIPFNLPALVKLVTQLGPDFLCLEMTPRQWQQRDWAGLPPEYAEALLPLAYQTDMVVVPIAAGQSPAERPVGGWRGWVIQRLRRGLAAIQRNAPNAAAVNQGWRHDVSNMLYHLITLLGGQSGPADDDAYRRHMTEQVVELARRDPGRRILVVVNVQHCHHLRPALARYPELDVVPYTEL